MGLFNGIIGNATQVSHSLVKKELADILMPEIERKYRKILIV